MDEKLCQVNLLTADFEIANLRDQKGGRGVGRESLSVPPALPPAFTPWQRCSCQHIENLVIKLPSIAPLGIKYSRVIKENILPRGTELNVKRGCE